MRVIIILFIFLSVPAFAEDIDIGKLFIRKCTLCHSIDLIKAKAKTKTEWEKVVKRMRGYADVISDEQERAIVRYLYENYSPEGIK